jgi:hypothetical protein
MYDNGGVKNKKNMFLLFTLYRMLGECSEDEDSFLYSIRRSTTKVDDLEVEFLSSDEENLVLVKFLLKKIILFINKMYVKLCLLMYAK